MKSCTLLVLFCLCTAAIANAQCPGTPVTLTTQAQVDNFKITYPSCTAVNVTITVNGNDITNLNGLDNLTSINKSLFIIDCPSLASLTGLSNLSNICVELTIENCDALTSLDGLESLPFIGGSLEVIDNANLTDLSALINISYINGALDVSRNPALTTLAGLDNVGSTGRYFQILNNNSLTSFNSLNSLTEVGNNAATNGRYLAIESNPNLTTINGLNNLVSVGTNFSLANNGNLTSLNAFTSLSTVGGELAITGNVDLTSILEFGSLSAVSGNLVITNNNLLTDCEAQGICDFLEGPGTAIISNNDPGCNSVAQVEAECALLPVELETFVGKIAPAGVLLNWQTASEKNNAYFQVEHSLDGRAFKPVGRVEGKGTVQSANSYQFTHRQPMPGVNYYRLRQVDFDARFEYSHIVSVFVQNNDNAWEIFPNPTNSSVWLKGVTQGEPTARVTDLTGRVIVEKIFSENGDIDLSGQPKGIYFIEIQTDNQKVVKRVVKE